MSLRDWFAGQALIGLCMTNGFANQLDNARRAYLFADDMLEERSK